MVLGFKPYRRVLSLTAVIRFGANNPLQELETRLTFATG